MIAAVTAAVADLGREVHRSAEMLRDLERLRRGDATAQAVSRAGDAEGRWRDGLAAMRRAAALHEHAARLQADGGHPERAARERTRAAACHASYARAIAAHPEWDPGESAPPPGPPGPDARRDGAAVGADARRPGPSALGR
jgi:hypothetical protein